MNSSRSGEAKKGAWRGSAMDLAGVQAVFSSLTCEHRLEEAMFFLAFALKDRPRRGKKPVFLHSIRVGVALLSMGFSEDAVIAGILHDVLEKSDYTPLDLSRRFGTRVARIVAACTNDDDIADPLLRYSDSIKRCIVVGHDAVAVRVTDLLDNCERASTQGERRRFERLKVKATMLLASCQSRHVSKQLANELGSWIKRLGRSQGLVPLARRAGQLQKAQRRARRARRS